MSLYLREFEFSIVRIHCHNLFLGWGSEDLYYLNELVYTALSWEQGLTEEELGDDTSYTPYVDYTVVVLATEDQFWGSVISGTNVGHVWLSFEQLLGRPEISQLEYMSCRVN